MKLKHSVQERKREQEILARKQRELEREMRATKRKDIQVNLFPSIFAVKRRNYNLSKIFEMSKVLR